MYISKSKFGKHMKSDVYGLVWNTLLKSDVTCRDHVSVVMDPMNAGSRIINFIVNFIRDGTVFA